MDPPNDFLNLSLIPLCLAVQSDVFQRQLDPHNDPLNVSLISLCLAVQSDAFQKELDPVKAEAETLGRELLDHESELLKERAENARLSRV